MTELTSERASVVTPGSSLRVCVPEIGEDVVPAAQSEGTEPEPVVEEPLDPIREPAAGRRLISAGQRRLRG
jgi:hypothetical protein